MFELRRWTPSWSSPSSRAPPANNSSTRSSRRLDCAKSGSSACNIQTRKVTSRGSNSTKRWVAHPSSLYIAVRRAMYDDGSRLETLEWCLYVDLLPVVAPLPSGLSASGCWMTMLAIARLCLHRFSSIYDVRESALAKQRKRVKFSPTENIEKLLRTTGGSLDDVTELTFNEWNGSVAPTPRWLITNCCHLVPNFIIIHHKVAQGFLSLYESIIHRRRSAETPGWNANICWSDTKKPDKRFRKTLSDIRVCSGST